MAQRAAMFLTDAQRAPEVEHTNLSLMSETLALVCSCALKYVSKPDLATRLESGLLYPLSHQKRFPGNLPAGLQLHGRNFSNTNFIVDIRFVF